MALIFIVCSYSLVKRYRRTPWGSGGFFNLDGEKGAFGNGNAKDD